jgi:hypothetical protein
MIDNEEHEDVAECGCYMDEYQGVFIYDCPLCGTLLNKITMYCTFCGGTF